MRYQQHRTFYTW